MESIYATFFYAKALGVKHSLWILAPMVLALLGTYFLIMRVWRTLQKQQTLLEGLPSLNFKGRMSKLTFFECMSYLGLVYWLISKYLKLPLYVNDSLSSIQVNAMLCGYYAVLAVLVVILAIIVCKRLHDLDMSGWLGLLLFVPYVKYVVIAGLFLMSSVVTTKYDND